MLTTLKRALAVAALAAGALFTVPASAVPLTQGDSYYLGYISFFPPGSEEDNYINSLLNLGAGGGPAGCTYNLTVTCSRVGSTLNVVGLPTVVETGSIKLDVPAQGSNTGIDVTGWDYLLGKYDGPNYGSLVWYVGGLSGLVDMPATAGGYGLSHFTRFNMTTTTRVPEPATLGLLGLGLAGIGLARRRRRA